MFIFSVHLLLLLNDHVCLDIHLPRLQGGQVVAHFLQSCFCVDDNFLDSFQSLLGRVNSVMFSDTMSIINRVRSSHHERPERSRAESSLRRSTEPSVPIVVIHLLLETLPFSPIMSFFFFHKPKLFFPSLPKFFPGLRSFCSFFLNLSLSQARFNINN